MFYALSLKKLKRHLVVITAIIMGFIFVFNIPKYLFPKKYSQYVEVFSKKYELEPALIYAVIKAESKFNEYAVSRKNAMGLMQITEKTGEWGAAELGINNFDKEMLFTPEINIEIGCWYLKKLLNQYDDSLECAIAAYNAGSGNVTKWLNSNEFSSDKKTLTKVPFKETETYLKKIRFYNKVYNFLY